MNPCRADDRAKHIADGRLPARFSAMGSTVQRVVGVLVLLVAGMLSLPLAASLLDDQGTENWILPAQLLVMAVIGAGVTVALPALAPGGAPTGRRALTGAGWGLLGALVGVLVFWLLLNGITGA
jgi:hypothetical protein